MSEVGRISGKADRNADHTANPWSVPVVVVQIPETGLHRDIEASVAEREAMARVVGLREMSSAVAALHLTHLPGGGVHVVGRVSARIGQTCVVTLDPIETEVVEEIDLMFVPEAQVRELAESVNDDDEGEGDTPDPPEPIMAGMIDLGRLATDALFLGIDPYPRKPDAVFDVPVIAADPADHPFAALKALKPDAKPSKPKKPRGG